MAGYERQIALADRLIRQKGALATWRRFTGGGGNAASPDPLVPDDIEGVPFLVLPNKQNSLSFLLTMFPGTEVPTGGARAIMPGNVAFAPALRDKVFVGSTEYGIAKENGINLLAPNGDPILYYLRLVS